MRYAPLLVLVLFAAAGCASSGGKSASPAAAAKITVGPTVEADHGVVVSVCPIASRAGCDVLARGGNAVDAAVATAFTLAVTWPEAGNIGGGGFMLVHPGPPPAPAGDGEPTPPPKLAGPIFVDYRETAPAAVGPNTFAGKVSQHVLAGTPGTVRGLHLAYEQFGSGKVAWKDLVAPAATLAEGGFAVDASLARSLNEGLKGVGGTEFRRVYGKPDKGEWKPGDTMKLPELGKTLRRVADAGPAGFYEGPVAAAVADEMRRGGGLMTADDLKAYQAKVREPVVDGFRGYKVIAPPLPSSGGRAMLTMLDLLDWNDVTKAGRWSPRTSHLVVEAARVAFMERARWAGDPGFHVEPLKDRLFPTPDGVTFDEARAGRSDPADAKSPWPEKGGQTTHFSVVDAAGMAVSNTYTLEQSFGGKVVVKGAGFLLNNELGDFNPEPGVTDTTGKIGTPPNVAAPGKRPVSSMTPTIVTNADGRIVLVTGSPGGRTIINTVTQVVLNRLAFNMTLREAVDAPRLHHQWLPDAIKFEAAFVRDHADVVEALKAMGHKVSGTPSARQGDAHSIEVNPATGKMTGVADTRIGGAAAGY